MAKTPARSSLRPSLRGTSRTPAAAVQFANDSDDEIKAGSDDDDQSDNDDDNADDLRSLFEALQKRQQKKASARTAAFQNQKKALYNTGRKNVQDLVRESTELADTMRASVTELEAQEISYAQQKSHFATLLEAMEQEVNGVLVSSPKAIEELAARRAATINTCSLLVEQRPAQREKALQSFLVKARDQVESSRAEQKSATDAKALIKQYKNILRAAGNN
ncbi:hypothetical protein BD626DRAFT_158238 [Schizophyllum amplum]|uniref:Uncharacterized protein n=1 Tax=Schizophyllum amplum TaxID=97359 RepID=A0A550C195_9AGAR|nr:hypothetical protein BD626DRAFT_180770 [Auriculariopsis ampla]TRM59310.1 hypothetical protein BD626DRAFT_158238 [Auriculariopsis ampla]